MQHTKLTLLTFFVLMFAVMSDAQAFSFDFGDDDDYYHPYYGRPAYNPWYGPPVNYYRPRVFYHPQLNMYDSSTMVRKRQQVMTDHENAMDRLYEMLYGSYGFDRAEAIKLARQIEVTSGSAMMGNFHPGAVADFRSRTAPSYWGNEQTFKANASALQAAANDLALELAKKPTAEEGAILLPRRGGSYESEDTEKVPVSAAIWEKFNLLSYSCESCHSSFRGPRW